jgi:hypothetical protein
MQTARLPKKVLRENYSREVLRKDVLGERGPAREELYVREHLLERGPATKVQ